MRHYFNPASRAVVTHWMLAELDVDYESVLVDVHGGETASDAFRAINPMGKIPALVDEEVVVTEAAAICAYLADKYPEKNLAPAPNSPARGRYYRYLFFPGVTLEPLLTTRMLGVKDYSAASVGWGDYERGLAAVAALTPETRWALGEQFTAADVVFGGMLDFTVQFGLLPEPSAEVMAYLERLRARAAYQRAYGV